MIKRCILYLFVLTLMTMTAGCVSPINQVRPFSNAGSQNVVELPERVLIDRKDLPGDAELVMAAMINAIRGGDEKIPNVNFDPAGKHEFLTDGFYYKGFDVKLIDIIYYKTEKALDNVRYAMLEFGLYFSDAIGRSAYVHILAQYAVAKADVFITNSEYEILPNPYPRVRTFIVPRQAVVNASPKIKHSFTGLLALALKNAVTMEPTKEERIKREQYNQLSFVGRIKYTSDSIPESYCVMAFCMERLRPESRFVMSVSKSERPSDTTSSNPYYLNDNGWKVGIVGGKFALDAYDKTVFFHVQFNPGIDPSDTSLTHIGRFSSIKNYDTPVKTSANPYLEAWKKQGGEASPAVSDGVVSTGTIFLNPAATKDARLIQQRLLDFGFYTMKVDGAFGNGSKRSLQAFKKANGLADDSVWDLKTQKALFKGSSL